MADGSLRDTEFFGRSRKAVAPRRSLESLKPVERWEMPRHRLLSSGNLRQGRELMLCRQGLPGFIGVVRGYASVKPIEWSTGKCRSPVLFKLTGAGAPVRRPHRTSIMGWIHAVWIWLSRRHIYRGLNSLDGRLLDDVGIPREIVRQLGKPPWLP
jgi:uncharacterized protein YjiS (DUF1127 family)